MRFSNPFQNLWLPLIGGALLAIPALHLGERPAVAVLPSAEPPAPTVELRCGPFVESFAAMRTEAERIAILASSTAAPAEEDVASAAAVETWREIASAARVLNGWMWEASGQYATLNLTEAATVQVTVPLTVDIRAESAAVAGHLLEPASEVDTALLVDRMRAVERAALMVARSLEPLAVCEPRQQLSYAPVGGDCQTLDPEYELAMAGNCRF